MSTIVFSHANSTSFQIPAKAASVVLRGNVRLRFAQTPFIA